MFLLGDVTTRGVFLLRGLPIRGVPTRWVCLLGGVCVYWGYLLGVPTIRVCLLGGLSTRRHICLLGGLSTRGSTH